MTEKKGNDIGFNAQHGPADAPAQDTSPDERSVYQAIAAKIGKLVTEKNAAYGSAYIISARIMREIFPTGIHVDRIPDALLMVRIVDKLIRLANRPDAFGESPYEDISGYGICGVELDGRRPRPEPKDVKAVSTNKIK